MTFTSLPTEHDNLRYMNVTSETESSDKLFQAKQNRQQQRPRPRQWSVKFQHPVAPNPSAWSSYIMKYLVKLWYLTNLETHDARGNSYPNGVIAWWILSLLVTTSAFLAFIHESCHPFAVSVVLAFLFIGLWECFADAGAPNAKYGRWMDDASRAPRWHV